MDEKLVKPPAELFLLSDAKAKPSKAAYGPNEIAY